MREALFYDKISGGAVKCVLCPQYCVINDGDKGYCAARINQGGRLQAESYGRVTALSLDPTRKKPLRDFRPGSLILSVSSYGCNLSCPFCQNHHLSKNARADYRETSPPELARMAKELEARGNVGVAYTYNEPLVSYEYLTDAAKAVRDAGMVNVLVTNGYINDEPLAALLGVIDAAAIDLKSINPDFYQNLGGSLPPVLATIKSMCEAGVHVEVITLIIPGENDSCGEMDRLSAHLAGISPAIPLHLTPFHPAYLYSDKEATPPSAIERLAQRARVHLERVYC